MPTDQAPMPMRPLSRTFSGVEEAVVDLAQALLVGDLDVFQHQLGRVGRVQPHLLDPLAGAKARASRSRR